MTVIGEAFIAIRPQTGSGFEADLQKQVVPAGQRVAKTLATAIGGAFVAGKVKDFVKAGVDELKTAAAVSAQTGAVIKATGGAAKVSAEHVGELAAEQMRLSGTDDELIQSGANLLLTFKNVRNEVGKDSDVFDRATVAALDLSTAGFGSMESASVMLGKALNDPVKGMTALSRAGVTFTEDQKAMVRQLQETGDLLGAQKIILAEVEAQVGGSARAYGETLPGKLDIAQQSLENLRGTMVSSMAPALEAGAGAAQFFADQFAKQPEILQQVEGGLAIVVGGLGSVITPLKSGIDLWRSFGSGAQAAGTLADISAPVGNSAAAVGDLYANTGKATGGLRNMAGAALGAATQLGLIYTALNLLPDGVDHANLPQLTRDLLDFSESGRLGGELADALGGDLRTLQNAIEDVAKPSTAAQIGNVISTIGSLGTQHGVRGSLDDSRAVIEDLDAALTGLAQQDPAAAAAALVAIQEGLSPQDAERLVGLLDGYNDQLASAEVSSRTAAGSITQLDAAAEGATGGVDALAGATAELTPEQEAARRATERLKDQILGQKDALDELLGTVRSSIDADFAYKDSQDQVADQLATLEQLRKDGKGSTEEYRRAQDDVAQAMYDQATRAAELAVKQAELEGRTLTATEQAAIQQTELQKLADSLAPNNPLRFQLGAFIAQLEAVKSKETTITAHTTDAERKLRTILILLGEIDPSAGVRADITYAGPSYRRAHGGPIPQHLAYGGFPGYPMGTDTVPVWATPGEFMVQKSAVDKLGIGFMQAINRGLVPRSGPVIESGAIQVNGAGASALAVAQETLGLLNWELTTRDDR